MDFSIIEKQNDVTYEIPKVSFPAYEEYKEKAEAIAEYISSLEVNEENIKETKKTLADARKLTDRLNRIRIDMKKEILQNYTVFENNLKEITGIVDRADKGLRDKIKELDELEREAKKEEIHNLWKKRVHAFPELEKLIPDAFDLWLRPSHLNKSMSMRSVETDMTKWIKETLDDIKAVEKMGGEYLSVFLQCGSLSGAIAAVEVQKETEERIRSVNGEPDKEKAIFIVYGTKDVSLAERLLKENEINYRKEK